MNQRHSVTAVDTAAHTGPTGPSGLNGPIGPTGQSTPFQAKTEIGHYENFPVASLLCPPALRAPIAAIYHFARTADDIADEGTDDAQTRLHTLQTYREQLQLAADHASTQNTALLPPSLSPYLPKWAPVFGPLQIAIQQYQLPVQLLADLLDAFQQDIVMTRDGAFYADHAALLDYCRRSANPVGRLLLHLYGISDSISLADSDSICSALQLINFWQDPSVDIPRGRHYFTNEACARHGVSRAMLAALRNTPQTREMLRECCAQARAMLLGGAPLVHRIPGRAGWELRLVVQGGLCILDKLAQNHYDALERRPVLRKRDYVRLIWKTLWM